MAVNKVIVDDEVLIDLTQDTVTPADVRTGVTFHTKDGNSAVGVFEIAKPEKAFTINNIGLVNKFIYIGETLLDLSQDTITPEDVKEGKTFHMRNGEYCTGCYATCIPMIYSLVDDSAGTKQYCTCKFILNGMSNNIIATAEYLDTQKNSGSQYTLYFCINNKTGGKFKAGTKITLRGSISSDNSSPSSPVHGSTTLTVGEWDNIYGTIKKHEVFNKELQQIANKDFSFVLENDIDELRLSINFRPVFYNDIVLPGNISIFLEDIYIDDKLLKGNDIKFPNDTCFSMLERIYLENNINKEIYPYYIILRNNEDNLRLNMLLASEKIHITQDATYTQYPYAFSNNSNYLFYRYRGNTTLEKVEGYYLIFSSFNEILFNNYDIMYNGEVVKPTNLL